MSIFADETTETIPIPFDPPHTATIRQLTGGEVEEAQRADALAVASGGVRTWAERIKRMSATGDPKALEILADPLLGYDRLTIIRAGLLAWTYPQLIAIVPATEKTPAKDAVGNLLDGPMDFFAREILRRTKPALFQTPEDAKAAQKETEAVPSCA